MRNDLKFLGWKVLEIIVYCAGFPFLYVGAWADHLSDRCGARAEPYRNERNSAK